jgi:hypothetical protein
MTPSKVVVGYQGFGDPCYVHLHVALKMDLWNVGMSSQPRRPRVYFSYIPCHKIWSTFRESRCNNSKLFLSVMRNGRVASYLQRIILCALQTPFSTLIFWMELNSRWYQVSQLTAYRMSYHQH